MKNDEREGMAFIEKCREGKMWEVCESLKLLKLLVSD